MDDLSAKLAARERRAGAADMQISSDDQRARSV